MKFTPRTILIWICIISGGFYTFQLVKDFLEFRLRDSGYYFYESAVFASIWLLFIPFTYIIWKKLWFTQSIKNVVLTIPIMSCVHILIYALGVWMISGIFLGYTFHVFSNFKFGLLEYFLLVTLIYIIIFGIFTFFTYKNNTDTPQVQYIQNLVLSKNGNYEIIPVAQIISIHSDTPYVQIITSDKKFLDQITLKELQLQLDPSVFHRIHKSTIINLEQVDSFTSRMNGDYDIKMKNHSVVRMSRNFSADFKKRMFGNESPS